jgi:hypothetical protein
MVGTIAGHSLFHDVLWRHKLCKNVINQHQSTKKLSTTLSCCSCHHATRTLPHWPQGPSNQAYLSAAHLEASPASTFRASSSPAPALIKPQPAPAILSQESVHTMLLITHHTRKRLSTCPRTTQVLTCGWASFMQHFKSLFTSGLSLIALHKNWNKVLECKNAMAIGGKYFIYKERDILHQGCLVKNLTL